MGIKKGYAKELYWKAKYKKEKQRIMTMFNDDLSSVKKEQIKGVIRQLECRIIILY